MVACTSSTTASLLPPQTRRARARPPIMCTFYRGTIESILTSWSLCGMAACNASCRKVPSTDSESSWEDRWCPLLPSLQDIYKHPSHPQALSIAGDPTHRHTTSSVCYHQGGDWGVSKPGQTDWKTASSTRLSGSWTPSRPCPPSPLLPHESLNSDPIPPPLTRTHTHEHTHTNTHTRTHTHTHTPHTHTHTHKHTHWDKHRSLVQHWTDLIQLPLLTVLNKKDCSLSL